VLRALLESGPIYALRVATDPVSVAALDGKPLRQQCRARKGGRLDPEREKPLAICGKLTSFKTEHGFGAWPWSTWAAPASS
jgi:hypothetical protein